MKFKFFLLFFILFSMIPLVLSQLDLGYDNEDVGVNFVYTTPINYSIVNVNNSQYLQSLTPQQVADLYSETDPLSVKITGGIMTGNLSLASGLNFTVGSTLFVNDALGRVGIGTTAPSTKLDVQGVGNFSGTVYINNATDVSIWMYNQTSAGSIYNSTYATWSYNQTLPALNYKNWLGYNASIVSYTGFSGDQNFTINSLTQFNISKSGTNYTLYDSSLVLFMNFDNRSALGENSTHVKDLSKYGNNGTVSGATFNSTGGKYNGAYMFDGVNDYIDVLGSENINGSVLSNGFTVSAWINATGFGEQGTGRILDKSTSSNGENGFRLSTYLTTTQITFKLNAGTAAFSGNILLGKWQHVLVTISSAQLANFYIDGVLSGTANQNLVQPISTITTTNVLRIGNRATATDWTFNGSIDDVMIWNRSLSNSEISQLYNLSFTKYNSNTWNFNSSSIDNVCYINGTDNAVCTGVLTPTITNATIDFNDTVLFAKDYMVNSRVYSGDALDLFKGIQVENTITDEFQSIDYSKSTSTIKGRLGFSTIIKAVIQIINKLDELKQENEMLKTELCEKDKTYSWCK